MSIDPFTGRNPSYCFIDFHTAEDADAAMKNMQGQDVRGRPIKLNLHTQKTRAPRQRGHKYVFDRWKRSEEAPTRWVPPNDQGRRVYVSGLPWTEHQAAANSLIRDLFHGYPVEAVSKVVLDSATKGGRGQHRYCFVDLPTAGMARDAARALDGSPDECGGSYRVSMARPSQTRKVVREQLGGGKDGNDDEMKQSPARNLDGNWRSMGR